jgi:hypothetical protein
MTATNFARNAILDEVFGDVDATIPNSYFLGLSTTGISVSGSNATEPSGASYARVEISNDKTSFRYSSSGCILNAIAIAFAESSGSWGTCTTALLADDLTSGSIWFYQTLPSSIIVQNNTVVSFAASALAFTLS